MKSSHWLVGFLCGAAASLLFLSAAVGGIFSSFLLYLSPLPIFVAGLGWGAMTAAIAVFSGVFLSFVATSAAGGVLFLAMTGAIPFWIIRKALLNRQIDENPSTTEREAEPAPVSPTQSSVQIEWYPPGYLIAWAAGLTAAMMLVADLSIRLSGFDGGLHAAVAATLAQLLDSNAMLKDMIESRSGQISLSDITALIAALMPMVAGVIWTLALTGTLWLSQSLLTRSGRNMRPWVPFAYIELPPQLLWGLIAAAALSLIPSSFSGIAGTVAIILLTPYFLLGVAVIHVISASWTMRPLLLGLFYFLLVMFVWLTIPVAILGLVETRLYLRQRALSQS